MSGFASTPRPRASGSDQRGEGTAASGEKGQQDVPPQGEDAGAMRPKHPESADQSTSSRGESAQRARMNPDGTARGEVGRGGAPVAFEGSHGGRSHQGKGGDSAAGAAAGLPRELGERVQSGFQDMSRLLSAIKESLSSRESQVQQTLQALPDFLQQVPRIHRAEIECLAQISKQLEHMGTGTRDMLARFEGLPDLMRSLAVGQAEQARFLDELQGKVAESLEVQGRAIREGLETNRRNSETQLQMIRSLSATQEDIFSTFQNTQNRALNVFHRAQQQSVAQNREQQKVMSKQVEMLVEKVHSAQTRVFWLSIGFAALAAAGLIAILVLK